MICLLTSCIDGVIFTLQNFIVSRIPNSVLSRSLLSHKILSDTSQSLLAKVELFWDESLSIPL